MAMEHLTNYESVPAFPAGGVIMQQICFRIQVKSDAPLYTKYKVTEVSISIPEDRNSIYDVDDDRLSDDDYVSNLVTPTPNMLIEILPFGADSCQVKIPGWVDDVQAFESVGELLVFLDKIGGASA